MAKKKRLKRKDIKEDQLVTVALRLSRLVQEHFTKVVSGIVVLIAAVAIILFSAQARRNGASAADREFSLAMNQYQMGDREQAGTAFANVADQYSGEAGTTARYFLGECRMAQFRFEEAIDAYERYLAKAGDKADFSVAAKIAVSLCYEGLGQFDKAAEVADDLSKTMDPEDPRYNDVLYNAGVFYRDAGNRATALEFFRRVSENATGPIKNRASVWVALIE
jgi:tetratricopeptide (TPR) repeat protein